MTTTTEIKEAMAKAFFACAYADQYDEADNPGFSPMGCDWLDMLPEDMDPSAAHAADTLAMGIERDNKLPLSDVYHRAVEVKDFCRGDRDLAPAMFGHYLAMQAMGHGVGLDDAFGQAVYHAIKVPYVEFSGCSLAKDYFTVTAERSEGAEVTA